MMAGPIIPINSLGYFAHLLTCRGVLEQLLVTCVLLLCMRLMRAKLIGAEL